MFLLFLRLLILSHFSVLFLFVFFFFKQKTAYEMRISDWSSDVCSSDLSTWAVADSTIWRSRSVAISLSPLAPDTGSPLASISTFDRIGMVFLRSTTDCTWPRLLSKVARSIVAFISVFLPHKRSLRRD